MASKAPDLTPKGVLFINVLVEGNSPTKAATKANLSSWIQRVPLPYTATLDSVDPQPTMEAFFNVPRDQFIIIDLKTMQLVEIYPADPNGAVAAVESMLQ